jgi:hypothetical protein
VPYCGEEFVILSHVSQERIFLPEPDESSTDEWLIDIPEWHKQIITERMARYRTEGFIGRPWEEFEKEFMKDFDPELIKELEQELIDDDD